jgi:4-hydroxybutyrate dehydrogenase
MRQLSIRPQIHTHGTFLEFAKEFDLSHRDLLFTEEFIYRTHLQKLGLPCSVLCRDPYGTGEPDDAMIDRIYADAQQHSAQRIVAVGGGSVIDVGKILALRDAAPSSRLFQRQIPIAKEKQLVIVPTTCGTGSEVTGIAIAHIEDRGTKMGLADDALFADHAVLIPQLVRDLPYPFFVLSAIDALVHAAESYLSPKANAFTEVFSLNACEKILSGFCSILENGKDYRKEIIGDFLTASCFAGIAFSNAGVGPVHALAYPLGGNYHVAHGESNYQFFATVFNTYHKEKPTGKIATLAGVIAEPLSRLGINAGAEDTFTAMESMLQQLLPLKKLREYGMKEEEVGSFAQSVMDNQQRLLVNSYIPFSLDHAREIYGSRY